jgi:hypothetical protein
MKLMSKYKNEANKVGVWPDFRKLLDGKDILYLGTTIVVIRAILGPRENCFSTCLAVRRRPWLSSTDQTTMSNFCAMGFVRLISVSTLKKHKIIAAPLSAAMD